MVKHGLKMRPHQLAEIRQMGGFAVRVKQRAAEFFLEQLDGS
jgi:hypothetical protein